MMEFVWSSNDTFSLLWVKIWVRWVLDFFLPESSCCATGLHLSFAKWKFLLLSERLLKCYIHFGVCMCFSCTIFFLYRLWVSERTGQWSPGACYPVSITINFLIILFHIFLQLLFFIIARLFKAHFQYIFSPVNLGKWYQIGNTWQNFNV